MYWVASTACRGISITKVKKVGHFTGPNVSAPQQPQEISST